MIEVLIRSFDISDKEMISSIGVGCPGQCKDGVLVAASNFPTLKNIPFSAMLSKRFGGVPVVLLNDADAAMAAELWRPGGFTDVQNAAMVTLGTGIGISLVLNGEIFQGSHGTK